jgi:autotransporter passenger strand-loop-strand repeat protein
MGLYRFAAGDIGNLHNWSFYSSTGINGGPPGWYPCIGSDGTVYAPLPSSGDTVSGSLTGSGTLTVGQILGAVDLTNGTLTATQIDQGAIANTGGTISASEIDEFADATGGAIDATTISGGAVAAAGGSISATTISGAAGASSGGSLDAQTVYGDVTVNGGTAEITGAHPGAGSTSVSISVDSGTLTFGGFGGDPAGTTYSLSLSDNATLNGQGWNVVGIDFRLTNTSLTASANVSAGYAAFSNGATLAVEGDFTASGGMDVGSLIAGAKASTATLVCNNAIISSNDGYLDIYNATFNVDGNLTLNNGNLGSILGDYYSGPGILKVLDTLVVGGVPVSSFFPSDVILNDNNSSVTAANIIIGDAGKGRITTGALANTGLPPTSVTIDASGGSVVLGKQSGSTGTIDISRATSASFKAGSLTIGLDGTGTFNQNGTADVSGDVTLGSGSGGGTLNIAGTFTDGGALTVGDKGTGQVQITSGTLTVDGSATLGNQKSGFGTVSIISGGTLSVSGTLQVGGSGHGTLLVGGSSTKVSAASLNVGGTGSSHGSGTLIVSSGAVVSGAIIDSGGFAIASAGGSLSGSLINSGGSERIVGEPTGSGAIAGGTAIGTTVISGGTLELFEKPAGSGQQAGAVANLVSGAIVFSGSGGTLKLDGAMMSADSISGATVINGFGLGDTIDLTSVSFSRGGVVYLSSGSSANELTIVESGGTATLQLDPNQDFSSVSFRLSSDSAGSGTNITVVSGLSINLSYDDSMSGAPGGFTGPATSALAQVVSTLEGDFTNPDTLNISVGWGEVEGDTSAVSGGGAASIRAAGPAYTYSQIYNALNSGTSLLQKQADATLPTPGAASNPYASGTFANGIADAQALNLGGQISGVTVTNDSVPIDGWIGFASGDNWSYSGSTTPAGAEDFIGGAEHEISEVMGRVSYLGDTAAFSDSNDQDVSYPNAYSPMDLFRYAGPGYRDLTSASADLISGGYPAAYPTGYFSINSGTTDLATWNNYSSNGDLGDWYPIGAPAPNDSFNYIDSDSGGYSPLSPTDLASINVIGWETGISFGTLSGTPFYNAEVTSGNTLNVSSGGAASGTVVFQSGTMNVLAGGSGSGPIVSGGGVEIISGGGTDFGARISGGRQTVFGYASGGMVFSGGTQVVGSGGTASSTVVSSGGTLELLGGYTASGFVVRSGGIVEIGSGATLTGYSFSSGVIVEVLSKGTASNTTISSGGTLAVLSGGLADPTTISSGGTEAVSAGGSDLGARISGGEQDVYGRASGAMVFTGSQVVEAGGIANSTIIDDGGTETVSSGGTDLGGQISGGEQDVYGFASGTAVFTGSQVVEAGGLADSTTIYGDGNEMVSGGGTDLGAQISGGEQDVYGFASGTVVFNGSQVVEASGGLANLTTIYSAGSETVSGGGIDVGAQIWGGEQDVFGLARDAAIFTGSQGIEFGGVADSTTIYSDGNETVSGGGIDLGAQIWGGEQDVYGFASRAGVFTGSQVVEAGGVASSTTVASGGFEFVSSGGTMGGAMLSGGELTLSAGTVVSGAVVFAGSAGTVNVLQISGSSIPAGLVLSHFGGGDVIDLASIAFDSGGTATLSGTTLTIVESGHSYTMQFDSSVAGDSFTLIGDHVSGTEVVLSGGAGSSVTVVSSGQTLSITSGQASSGITVLSGGTFDVLSGGTASNTNVSSGGTFAVLSGGFADPTVVSSGGTETISAGGTDLGAQISGGSQFDYGVASGATVLGGSQVIESGGTASGTIVSSGGTLALLSGGSAINYHISSGGTLELGSGVTLSGFTVSGGVTLIVSGGKVSNTTVLSGGTLDLEGGSVQSGTTIRSGGILQIGLGQTLSGYVVSSGRVLETAAGGTVSNTAVASGGALVVLSGGLADPTKIASGGREIVSAGGTDSGALISGALLDYGTVRGAKLVKGSEVVEFGATASGSILSGGSETVSAGGSDFGAGISGGKQLDYGFVGAATVFKGSQVVESGGTASGTIVRSSAALIVSSGGFAEATTILSGGSGTISAGGSDFGALISGGKQFDSGFASGATVFTGSQVVRSGGAAVGTAVHSGGTLLVSSGGVAETGTLLSGGTERISGHSSDFGAVLSGGKQFVYGFASGATVFTGSQLVQSGGVASGTTVLSGGTEIVSGHASDFGARISGGIELDSGIAAGATIFAGSQVVGSAGIAINTTVSSGGTLDLLKGGVASGAVVASGGTFEVASGATLSGFTASNGATLLVSGGKVVNTTVLSGGTLELFAGATQSGTTASSGATIEIGAAEKLSGFTAGTGVTIEVLSGGTVTNTTVASGGTFVASGLVTVSGTLTVSGTTSVGTGAIVRTASSGTAILAGTVDNSGTLFASGAHSLIDLASSAVVSGGGIAEVGNGIVDIQAAADNENVIFLSGGTGGLELSDTGINPSAFGGTVIGFGQNTTQFIDLTAVTSGAGVSLSYSSNSSSSGVLTVTSGGSAVATINFSGSYTSGSFHLTSGAGGTVKIFDPPVEQPHPSRDDAADDAAGEDRPVTSGGHGNNSTPLPDASLLTYESLNHTPSIFDWHHGSQLQTATAALESIQSFSPIHDHELVFRSSDPNDQSAFTNKHTNNTVHSKDWDHGPQSHIAISPTLEPWDFNSQNDRPTPHLLAVNRGP